METSTQLANRFREVLLDGTWIANTNFQDQLSGMSLEHATTKIGSLNTIAALAWHINYYIAGVLEVIKGGELTIRDKYSFDMPVLQSREEWEQLLKEIWANSEKFAAQVERMSEEKLDSVFVKEEYGTYRRSIEGMIEHSYYHLGQVSLIKKMVFEAQKG
jgi:uncharacterized damage-inducible protein DinB